MIATNNQLVLPGPVLPGTMHVIYKPTEGEVSNWFCTKHGVYLNPPMIVSDGVGDPHESCQDCILEESIRGEYVIADAEERVEILCEVTDSCRNIAEDECVTCGKVACTPHMDPGGYVCSECAQQEGDEDSPEDYPDTAQMVEDIRRVMEIAEMKGGNVDA